jgi:hypothetical protein
MLISVYVSKHTCVHNVGIYVPHNHAQGNNHRDQNFTKIIERSRNTRIKITRTSKNTCLKFGHQGIS